jgi:two-component system, cell cycle response regulator
VTVALATYELDGSPQGFSSGARGAHGVLSHLQRLADDLDRRQGRDGHSHAVAIWARQLTTRLELSTDVGARVVTAARLHDIGKLGLPDSILTKPGPLAEHEWEVMREHPIRGARMLAQIPSLSEVAPIVRDHHERPDGLGYPAGKSGAELRIEPRIVAVCDAWAAMRARGPGRMALSVEEARTELIQGQSSQFDYGVARAFLDLLHEGAIEDGAGG